MQIYIFIFVVLAGFLVHTVWRESAKKKLILYLIPADKERKRCEEANDLLIHNYLTKSSNVGNHGLIGYWKKSHTGNHAVISLN